jgi:hypothetical protein
MVAAEKENSSRAGKARREERGTRQVPLPQMTRLRRAIKMRVSELFARGEGKARERTRTRIQPGEIEVPNVDDAKLRYLERIAQSPLKIHLSGEGIRLRALQNQKPHQATHLLPLVVLLEESHVPRLRNFIDLRQ